MRPGFWQVVIVLLLLIAFFRGPLGRIVKYFLMRSAPRTPPSPPPPSPRPHEKSRRASEEIVDAEVVDVERR